MMCQQTLRGAHRLRGALCLLGVLVLCGSVPVYGQGVTSGTWGGAALLPEKRHSLAAAAAQGLLFVTGGRASGLDVSSFMYTYDPAQDTWSEPIAMPIDLEHHAMVAVQGKLYIFGGQTKGFSAILARTNQVFEYDPATGQWAEKRAMRTARNAHAAAVYNDKIFVFGGRIDATVGGVRSEAATDAVEMYDPARDVWEQRTPMPVPMGNNAAATLDSLIYVIAGDNGALLLRNVLTYAPKTDSWGEATPVPGARNNHAAVALGGALYMFGGTALTTPGTLDAVEAYTPHTDAWRPLSPMPTPRFHMAAAALGDKIYLLGGRRRDQPLDGSKVVEVFAPPLAEPTARDEAPALPKQPILIGNYPNPFRRATTIRFALPAAALVRLSLFDLQGREVEVLAARLFSAGEHEVVWHGSRRSGLYFYRLQAGGFAATRPMLLVR